MSGPHEHNRSTKEKNRARSTRSTSSSGNKKEQQTSTRKDSKTRGRSTGQDDWTVRRRRGRRIDMGPNVEAWDFSEPKEQKRFTEEPDWWHKKPGKPVGPPDFDVTQALKKKAFSIDLSPSVYTDLHDQFLFLRKGRLQYKLDLVIRSTIHAYTSDVMPKIKATDAKGDPHEVDWAGRTWEWSDRPRTDPTVYYRPEKVPYSLEGDGWLGGRRFVHIPIWITTGSYGVGLNLEVDLIHVKTGKVFQTFNWNKLRDPNDSLPERLPAPSRGIPYIDTADVIDFNRSKELFYVCSTPISVSGDASVRSEACAKIGGKRIALSYKGFYGNPYSAYPRRFQYIFDKSAGWHLPQIGKSSPEESVNAITTPTLFEYFWNYVLPAIEEETYRYKLASAFLTWLPWYVGEGFAIPAGAQKYVSRVPKVKTPAKTSIKESAAEVLQQDVRALGNSGIVDKRVANKGLEPPISPQPAKVTARRISSKGPLSAGEKILLDKGLTHESLQALDNMAIDVSKPLVKGAPKLLRQLQHTDDLVINFINDFHNSPGFEKVLINWAQGFSKASKQAKNSRRGARLVMDYASSNLKGLPVRFEWPVGFKRVTRGGKRSGTVAARDIDIVIDKGTRLSPKEAVYIEFKSWSKDAFLKGFNSLKRQLTRDTAFFDLDIVKWVFSSKGGLTKKQVIDKLAKVIENDVYLTKMWGGSKANIRKWLDSFVEVFP